MPAECPPLFTQTSFPAKNVASLCWRGDELIDWVSGGRAFALDGTERPSNVYYPYRFDAATSSPDGRFVVIYEKLGTKGLLFDNGRVLREINRSYYFAETYEFPLALFDDPDRRTLLAHCPKDYCRLDLEEAESGRLLTSVMERKPADFFHSRLAASPSGTRLLSAGWVWHPRDEVIWFDVAEALANPQHLDTPNVAHRPYNPYLAEESAACWLDDDRLIVAASAEPEMNEAAAKAAPRLRPCGLAVYDVARQTCLRTVQLGEPAGTIFAVGDRHLLSLYRHPKLIDMSTGEIVHSWSALKTGLQISSIINRDENAKPPPMAFDRNGLRFAVAEEESITVITFDRTALAAADRSEPPR
ncbi:hypothetical protein BRADO5233 [Bradyrhizobium sp. ORS 278]|uniref:hypothetical protein n=1 Tax=Bradyrhizobium sp. (strain ORS 278) TaxID=114615 RepID=UPI0001508BC7|nr:hypothetical protein [Bradyrhizobium sp. ORS 278]CAL78921.1 hypothetical protein BRADO5233 [Bradyrhizobium sp. ORS 278]